MKSPLRWLPTFAAIAFATAAWAGENSYYTDKLEDPKAVYLDAPGDGATDDTAALQKAVNTVVENTTRGILFVPPGTYRISKTIQIWPGIRIIGFGKTRPVFVLGDDTPGYQADEPAYLFHFAGNIPGHKGNGAGFIFQPGPTPKPAIDFTTPPGEANPGTFYSALSNVDIRIGKGNPGAVAIRSTYAQHCFLAHIDFEIGSGLAGINDGGNFCEDLHFHGGKYGIMTRTPSPGWQYCLVDTTFDGQSVAAIQSQLAGLTLIRPQFKNMPTAIAMSADRGDQLWMKDGTMEQIAGPALIIGNEENARNQINLINIVCRETPVFAKFAASGKQIAAPGAIYRVEDFSHGLHVSGGGDTAKDFDTGTHSKISALKEPPSPAQTDVAAPPPQSTWVNVSTLGVKGDGVADETAALRQAIASNRALYFPSGAYRISDTLVLRPDTVLIGLNPASTRIFIDDNTPAFSGVGAPVPMIETPSGGTNIITGIGVYTSGANPRAVAVKWMAGEHSLVNDVRFLGGHGTSQLSGDGEEIYNNNHTSDPNPQRRWDSQYPSLWITDGGGGTFMDIWTPSTFAQCGLMISRTSTPGRMYEISVEHHVRNEVKLQDVSNWEICALQLEEERGEGGFCQPLDIDRCHDVTIANLFIYRVISSYQPFRSAVKISESTGIQFRNFHCWSNSKADFDNAIVDVSTGLELRQREFATFTAGNQSVAHAPDSRVQKLAGGFFRLAGGTVDKEGRLYAVDARKQRIFRWTGGNPQPQLISDHPLDPLNLACDASGNLLVVSYTGSIYALDPEHPDAITVLKPVPAAEHPGATAILPGNYWTGGYALVKGQAPKAAMHFVSADGSVFIPANDDFITGKLSWGVKDHDLIRAYGLIVAKPGKPVYITLESAGQTYSANLDAAGNLSAFKLFANHGGEAVATDADGNVYIAEGQVFVYDKSGKLRDVITVPERPLGLVFGGKDRRTLYIPAGTSLYAMHIGGLK
ncbi:MAG TPA: glycosyl hydrolase family 28-related protein [Chthoniobacteraceae bacterium]|nr:glycosyl hydrolase family 28-related protein [Chthoniobacteraceae bacterium]